VQLFIIKVAARLQFLPLNGAQKKPNCSLCQLPFSLYTPNHNFPNQRPDISFFWGYYILFISRPKKESLSRQKKDMYICISYILCQIFTSIVTVSEQRKARPGSTALHHAQPPSTFYQNELKPRSISGAARKWQITA
jgi:hypothetical protein